MRLLAVLLAVISLVACSRDPNVVKQRYLENGNKYFDRGKYKEAAIMYRNALRKDQRFGPAHYKLALAELKLGRISSALGALRRAHELLPPTNPNHWDSAVKIAEIYLLATPDKKLYAEVEDTVQKLLQRDPNSYDGNRLSGDLAYARAVQKFRENRKEESEQLLQQALASFRKANSVKPNETGVIMQMARTATALQDVGEAERLYRSIVQKDKSFMQAYMELYRLYLLEKKPLEGEQVLKQALAANPKQYSFMSLLATHYFGMQRRDEMVKVLSEIKSHAKEFDQAYFTVGDLYLRIGEGDEAIRQYREGMAADPKQKAKYQKRIIEVLLRQNKPAEAGEIATAILKDNPNDADARGLQASFLLDKGEISRALTELQAVVTRSPENPVAHFNLARAHSARGEVEQARQQFQKAIDLRPDYIPARLGLAQLQLARREGEAALKSAEEILAIDPQNMQAKLVQAAALLAQKKFSDSRSLLSEMAAKYPNTPSVMLQSGVTDLSENRFKDAEESFRKAYHLNPADTRGLMGLVETFLAQNRVDQALAAVQAEADKAPNRTDLRVLLGNVATRSGKYDIAVAEFQKALAGVDKNSAAGSDLYWRIGETYRRKGDFGAAVNYVQKAREIRPDNSGVVTTLALSLDSAGRKQEARQAYEALLKIEPTNAVALNNLAFILAEGGADLDQALTMAQRAKQLLPNLAEVSDTLGWIYLKKNLSDNAIQIFSDLVAKTPHKATYRYHLGMALSQKGDKRQAAKELQEALKSDPTKDERDKIQALLARLQ
jgi:tetratricopeptide (TPR) repeat protein